MIDVKRRKQAPEVRRSEILQAARSVFAQKGFAEASVDDIAAQAGVGKGTLYLYFNSKERIFMAALLEDARRLDEVTRERMAQAPCWQGKIRSYVQVRLEYLDTHLDFVRIFLGEIRGKMLRGAPLCSEFFQVTRESESQLSQVIAAAVARGEVRDVDPELAGITIVDMTRGLLERRLVGRCGANTARDTEFLLDLIWHALERKPEQR